VGTLAVTTAVVAWPGLVQPADAATATVPLVGYTSWDTFAENLAWETAIIDDTHGSVNLNLHGDGDFDARKQLTTGVADFSISGTPFQPGELKAGQAVIPVPIMPTGLEFLYNASYGGHFGVIDGATTTKWGPQGTNVVPWVQGKSNLGPGCQTSIAPGAPVPPGLDPNGCPVINVPANNLAAMAAGSSVVGPDNQQFNYWASSSIWSTWPGFPFRSGDGFVPANTADNAPTFLWDGWNNDENYYLQKWFNTLQAATKNSPGSLSPEEDVDQQNWEDALGRGFAANPTEAIPTSKTGVAVELDSLLNTNAASGSPTPWAEVENDGVPAPPAAGKIAMTPPSGWTLVNQQEAKDKTQGNPDTDAVPEMLSIPNADGDFVAPTPAAIEEGIDTAAAPPVNESACSASNTNAMYAATHPVAGAYPLSWVDCMYVPTKGLTLEKTDAIAGVIRYLVTDGQNVLEPSGDGRLPPVYIGQAEAAANTVVTDNCAAAGGKVVLTASATPWTPISPGVQGLGAVDECEAVVAPSPPPTKPGAPAPGTKPSGPSTTTAPGSPKSSTGTSTPGGSGPGPGTSGSATSAATGLTGFGGSGFSSGPFSGFTSASSGPGSSSGGSPTTSLSAGVDAAATSGANGTLAAKTAASGSGQGGSGQSGSGSGHRPVGLAASIAANLPIPLSGAGQTIDKLSALLLGGLLFLGGRSLVRRVVKARRG